MSGVRVPHRPPGQPVGFAPNLLAARHDLASGWGRVHPALRPAWTGGYWDKAVTMPGRGIRTHLLHFAGSTLLTLEFMIPGDVVPAVCLTLGLVVPLLPLLPLATLLLWALLLGSFLPAPEGATATAQGDPVSGGRPPSPIDVRPATQERRSQSHHGAQSITCPRISTLVRGSLNRPASNLKETCPSGRPWLLTGRCCFRGASAHGLRAALLFPAGLRHTGSPLSGDVR
jgi:hypothetical protein